MGERMGKGNSNNYKEKETGRKKNTAVTRFVMEIMLRNTS